MCLDDSVGCVLGDAAAAVLGLGGLLLDANIAALAPLCGPRVLDDPVLHLLDGVHAVADLERTKIIRVPKEKCGRGISRIGRCKKGRFEEDLTARTPWSRLVPHFLAGMMPPA